MLRPSPGFEESPVHRCTRRKTKKLIFTSPRFECEDFQHYENLSDASKRWDFVSEQAGDHKQSGKVLVLHRTMSPKALRYGMTKHASLRVHSLSLAFDQRQYDIAEWVDIISVTLINLENISIVDSQFRDLSIRKRMQRQYILQRMPNLRSIDEICVTEEERSMSRNKSDTASEIVDCDADDETASLDSFYDPPFDAQSPEHVNRSKDKHAEEAVSWCDHAHSLESENIEDERARDHNFQSVIRGSKTVDDDCLQVLTAAQSTMKSVRNDAEPQQLLTNRMVENKKDNVDAESFTSSHIEWTAACGVLAFRSDNVCAPDIRLPFCGTGAKAICDEENKRLRAQAKKALQRKNNHGSLGCTPVQRHMANGRITRIQGVQDGARCKTKFFPSETTSAMNELDENTPVVRCQTNTTKVLGGGEAVGMISQSLPLVRMHGYKDMQQAYTQITNTPVQDPSESSNVKFMKDTLEFHMARPALGSSKENAWTNSMFDTIYDEDDDEDEIIEENKYQTGWRSKIRVEE